MKQTHLLFAAVLVAAVLFTQQANATIWRVNNKSNYNATKNLWGDNFGGTQGYPVFAQINQAESLASSGDTIYVEASSIPYSDAAINRKLIIIGPGYLLSQNSHVSSTPDSASIGEIDFNTGSEGSQIIGMSQISLGSYSYLNIYVNDITVKRCSFINAISIAPNLNDVYIIENFFNSTGTGNAIALNTSTNFTYPIDLVFNNNICKKTLVWNGSILQCNNNVFDGPTSKLNLQFTTSEFKNNILKPLGATTNINNGTNLNVSYNIGTSATQFGTANNNLVVPAINSLFMSSASPDGMYQLAANSVASNSGSDGTDRGAFGGAAVTDRYTLSGLAAIPVIYSVSTQGATSTDLPVTVGARTIK